MSHSYNRKALKALHDQVILDLLESIGTPHSLAIAISYRYKSEWKELVGFRHPNEFLTAEDYRLYSQANALLSKSLIVASSSDEQQLSDSSLFNFLKIEDEVDSWNKTLLICDFRRDSLLNQAAILIERIIGFAPPEFDMQEPRYTTGATASLSGLSASIVGKIQSEIDVSPHAQPYFIKWVKGDNLVSAHIKTYGWKVSKASVMEFVPKDFSKQRIICKEPLFNMLAQRYFSKYIRKQLKKRCEIDIGVQADFHRQLLESNSELFATIDQSDASDRISQSLVKRLLPPSWFTLLDRLRSRNVRLPNGDVHVLKKFMTQGNGFTFELETLIFWAIGTASLLLAGKNKFLSVFGDDMLCYDNCGATIMEALTLVGLQVNKVKSYTDSRFKESCGIDTFDGFNVRPIYLKDFSERIYGYFELINRIREIARASCSNVCTDTRYKRAYNRVLHAISVDDRLFGPPSYGDSVICTFDTRFYSRKGRKIRVLSARRLKGNKAAEFQPGPRDCYTATMIYGILGYDSQGTLIRGAPRIACRKYVHLSESSRSIEWL